MASLIPDNNRKYGPLRIFCATGRYGVVRQHHFIVSRKDLMKL